jgi:transposase
VRQTIVWARLFGVAGVVVEAVELDEVLGAAVARVRLRRGQRRRCGVCGRRCSLYDRGEGRRLWRAMDLGTRMAFVEAEVPRVSCRTHGVVVARVPWARHGSRFTRGFEDQCAWLAVHISKTTLAEFVRIAWRTVGGIIGRVVEEWSASFDGFAGLSKIGIDEVSFRRGQRYLTVVVDHETARVVWVQEGRDEATLERFFDRLGPVRAAALRFVTADGAAWIKNVVKRRCPQATLCLDPFHVVSWATDALDEVRREVWNEARRSGQTALARELKGARYALWKNPENLTRRQQAKLADIARTNKPLYRAHLLKEQLREVFRLPFRAAVGSTLSFGSLRAPGALDPISLGRHRDDTAVRPEQRASRVSQHPYPPADTDRLRLPLGPASNRLGHARPWWNVPAAARTAMTTHGKSRRPSFRRPAL